MENALGDHGEHELTLGRGLGGEQGIQTEAAEGAEHGLDVAVRAGAFDTEDGLGGQELLASEGAADKFDEVGGEMGDVAEGFVLDLRADAEGAAEEVGVIGLAFVGAGCGGHMNGSGPGRHS
jgi:hypothetical protein